MNKTIKLLMISDVVMITGFGLVEPILAIFIKDNIVGGSIVSVGIASAVFLIIKSIVQLPFSRYVDSHKDKFRWLIVGALIISAVPFLYLLVTHIAHIYLLQAFYGIGSGLAFPTWLSLWSTHLDKHHESFEWSLYSTLAGIGVAITAALGALLAEYVGFNYTFLLVGITQLIGSGILIRLSRLADNEESNSKIPHLHIRHRAHKT